MASSTVTDERKASAAERFAAYFRYAPMPLWEEDYSRIKAFLDTLRQEGIDPEAHFSRHPEDVERCRDLLAVHDPNAAALSLFGAAGEEAFGQAVKEALGGGLRAGFVQSLAALGAGRTEFLYEGTMTARGAERVAAVWLRVLPGCEDVLSCVLVSLADVTGEKRAEESVRRSEGRYRSIFANSGTATIIVEADGTIVLANREFEQLSGLAGDELAGKKNWRDFLSPGEAGNMEQVAGRLRGGGVSLKMETRFLDNAGREKTVLASVARFDEEERCIISLIDISKRSRALESLKESEERLRIVVENSPNFLFQQDRDLRYVWVSKAVPPYMPKTLVGKTDADLYPENEAGEMFDLKRKVMAAGRGAHAVITLPFDIGRRQFDVVYEPWRDAQGGVIGILGYARDITERLRAQEEIRQGKERLELVAQKSPDRILQQDRDLRYVWAPGGQGSSLLGRSDADVFPAEEAKRLAAVKRRVMETGTAARTEIVISSPEGDRYFDALLAPWRDEQGRIDGVLEYLHEITGLKRTQEQLRESLDRRHTLTDSVISLITKIVETRDPYTAGHQRRVSQLAYAIARELGVPGAQAEGVRVAGMMHDIGKLYVPVEILTKPGRINYIEYEIIKVHPQAGYDILKLIEFPWPIAEIAHQHQERLNGSGYPFGLMSENILPEAKMVSVADTVEAMTFHRPYKTVGGLEKALAEITEKKGVLYDATAVDACLKLFREKGFRFS